MPSSFLFLGAKSIRSKERIVILDKSICELSYWILRHGHQILTPNLCFSQPWNKDWSINQPPMNQVCVRFGWLTYMIRRLLMQVIASIESIFSGFNCHIGFQRINIYWLWLRIGRAHDWFRNRFGLKLVIKGTWWRGYYNKSGTSEGAWRPCGFVA